ncbi:thioesterase II family protein [Streptomyces sp. NPDC018610]|uniref:thioesterase II family protein n=1 Tax=Streptomyces sp. NPDC018610 TaxID=3365049 RepID=UPI0037B6F29A
MGAVDPAQWFHRYEPAPRATRRLVCFPHAGGAASYFVPVARAMAGRTEVLAVQYPGRQERRHEPCVTSVEELARAAVDALAPSPDRPLTLFGHSMGAMVAFEAARLLEREGKGPRALVVSGRRAPSRVRPAQDLVHLRDDEGLMAEIRRLSGTDDRILADEELLRMILPAIRSDYRAVESYRYRQGPPLSCPVLALIGDDDPQVTRDEAQAWAEHTTARFDMTVFPGGHFYLNSQGEAVIRAIEEHMSATGSPAAC